MPISTAQSSPGPSTRLAQQARIDEYVQSLSMGIQRSNLAMAASPVTLAQDLASGSAAMSTQNALVASLRLIRATGRIVLKLDLDFRNHRAFQISLWKTETVSWFHLFRPRLMWLVRCTIKTLFYTREGKERGVTCDWPADRTGMPIGARRSLFVLTGKWSARRRARQFGAAPSSPSLL